MPCLTALTLACLFDPSSLYVTAGIDSAVRQPAYEGRWCRRYFCEGPMGTLKIGMRAQLTDTWSADYGVLHSSYFASNDRGVESVFVTLTWKPFTRR